MVDYYLHNKIGSVGEYSKLQHTRQDYIHLQSCTCKNHNTMLTATPYYNKKKSSSIFRDKRKSELSLMGISRQPLVENPSQFENIQ